MDELVAEIELFATNADELVGVRCMGDIVAGKDQDFRETPGFVFVFKRVFPDFADNLAIAVRRGNAALDFFRRELPFVFDLVENGFARLGVDPLDLVTRFEKDAFNADVRLYFNRLVIDKVTVANRLLDSVAEDRLAKERHGMGGWCSGEPDANGIEMVDGVAPDAGLLGGVAAMAFVGDDQVKGVVRDRELEEIFLTFGIRARLREGKLRAEDLARHALNGGDVNEGVAGLWIGEVLVWKNLWVERRIVSEIVFLKALAVEFVFVGELVVLGSSKRVELPDGLGCERFAVDEEKNATGEFAFQQPINLSNRQKGFARAGRHRKKHVAPPADDGVLGGNNAIALIGTQVFDIVWRSIEKPRERRLRIESKRGFQC